MKTIILITLFMLPVSLHAEALFEQGIEPGYYICPTAQISSLNGKGVALMGFEACFLANSEWVLGVSGGRTVNNSEFNTDYWDNPVKQFNLSYLGVKLGYVANPAWLIHWTASGIFGGGTVRFSTPDDAKLPDQNYPTSSDDFFLFEPEFGAEINITDYLRLYGGTSFRWVAWADKYYGIDSNDLSGVGIKFSLRFGKMAPDPTDSRTGMKW